MSKLPVVSGADVVRALEKVGFVVYRQRGSHITVSQGPTSTNYHSKSQRIRSRYIARNHPADGTDG